MSQDRKTIKILIAEDDHLLRDTLRSTVEEEGYSCLVAKSGTDALTLVKEHKASVIVSDVRMPEVDGLEFLKNVKPSNTPVILITAFAGDLDLKKATALGAADFLTKPSKREDSNNSLELALLRGGEGMSPQDAINRIYPSKESEYDGFFMRGLFNVLKFQVPDKLKNISIANDIRETK